MVFLLPCPVKIVLRVTYYDEKKNICSAHVHMVKKTAVATFGNLVYYEKYVAASAPRGVTITFCQLDAGAPQSKEPVGSVVFLWLRVFCVPCPVIWLFIFQAFLF